ncbi:MAG TPA: amidophosphoribosyltransferase [Nitrospirae bacterium]|nr:amidophosphoribosyltransferase [Nitrospirota bacterium]
MALDKFKDECAVFAVFGHPEAANLAYLGLYSLQHRGQEASGIVSSDETKHHAEIGMGHVSEVFNESNILQLKGKMAIGHNRYSTHGRSQLKNAQPMAIEYARGPLALAHNGNLVNADVVRQRLEEEGSIFRSTMDSEVIIHLIAKSKKSRFQDQVTEALSQLEGAYSLALMGASEMIIARDPHGFRPLAMGTLGAGYVFASETCAFDLIGAKYIRDVAPGELVVVNNEGLFSYFPFEARKKNHCVFEYIYFARPDSNIFGKSVHNVRKKFGRKLAHEKPVEADMVIPVPDSGVVAALGYAEESGIPFETGIIRNHYVGRTFIEPTQSIRHFGVKIKHNAVKEAIKGNRVVVVDDSIVRGTTSRKIIKMIREAGAKEVHMRISSPPTTHSCFYGIDTPSRSELIGSTYSVEDIAEYLDADTLAYLSIEAMMDALEDRKEDFCKACFDGNYIVPPVYAESQLTLLEKRLAEDEEIDYDRAPATRKTATAK